MERIRGKAWKYGDDVNTDVIFPGKYTYTISDPQEMAQHALEDLDPGFVHKVAPGDVIVAGKNFGCGSSREQAATCLKYAGVGAIIATSFSRIFYRNAINQGLPALAVPEAAEMIQAGQTVTIDLAEGQIMAGESSFSFPPPSAFVMGIMEDGGLIPHVKRELATHKLVRPVDGGLKRGEDETR
ncbi:MAG: 3-isopropylmalate dehydratase [candidate division Zixibacteria bacterium SM23_81]|nr:MAG: 3-isopropylmalate dehydratase [candidate division Zixibacteria bacterium SM23_81]